MFQTPRRVWEGVRPRDERLYHFGSSIQSAALKLRCALNNLHYCLVCAVHYFDLMRKVKRRGRRQIRTAQYQHDAVARIRIKTHGKTYGIIIGRATTGTPPPATPATTGSWRPPSLAGSIARVREAENVQGKEYSTARESKRSSNSSYA